MTRGTVDCGRSAASKAISLIFWLLLFLGIGFRVYAALKFQTRAWIDEIWVVLNPGYKLFSGMRAAIDDPLRNEVGIRSWIPPFLLCGYLKILSALNIRSGAIVLPAVRSAMAMLSAAGILSFCALLRRKLQLKFLPALPLLVLLFTPELVHYGAVADLAVIGTPFLLLGLTLIFWAEERVEPSLLTWIGAMCLTFSALIRFQFGVFPVLVLGWLFYERRKSRALLLAVTGVAMLALDFMLHTLIYGYPILPLLNYFKANAMGLAASYGVTPFYFGFELLWRFMTEPVFLLTCLSAPLAFKRLRFLAVASAIFFSIHCFIGHKEYRFFYPSAVLFAGISSAVFQKWLEDRQAQSPRRAFGLLACFLVAFLSVSIWRAEKKVGWHDFEYPGRLETLAGTQPDIRGLIVYGWSGIYHGGNYTFHQPLPYIFAQSRQELIQKKLSAEDYNFVIAREGERSPCSQLILSEGGASLYRCNVDEIQRLLL